MLDDLSTLSREEVEYAVERIKVSESGDESSMSTNEYFYAEESEIVGRLELPESFKIDPGEEFPDSEVVWKAKKEDIVREAEKREIEAVKEDQDRERSI